MNVLVIGLGSMGRRRIRLLKKLYIESNVIGVDLEDKRRKQAKDELGIDSYPTLDAALERREYDAAFISTSPLSHAELTNICLRNNMHVFTELNLVSDMYDENIKLAKEVKKVLFLSSTFLYRKEMQYMHSLMAENDKKVNYLYHVGQYLPDWHPWESYKNFFVGDKRTNGCREFMAVEFPWIMDVFGGIKSYDVRKDKISSLELDYPDNYLFLIEHENGNKGIIALDVVSRKASRNLEIYGENVYLTWDGTPQGLILFDAETKKSRNVALYREIDKRKEYCASIIEDAYLDEIKNFFDVINGRGKSRYSFEKDKALLELIDKFEKE